jgi:WD40 repeat protein
VWDTETWEEVRTLEPGTVSTRNFAFSADESKLALSMKGRVQVWSMEEWKPLDEVQVAANVVNGLAFSPDGRLLAVGAADRKIRVWHVSDDRPS